MLNPLDYPICFSQPRRIPDDPSTPNWIEHVPFAMLLIDLLRPGIFVELGTHTGVSYCGFCQAIHDLGTSTRAYAVDTWQGDPQAGYYGAEVLVDLRTHHDPRYSRFSCLLQCTFDEAVSQFADGSIDLLHIDGCHEYEDVRHDFENWLPKLSSRALVLLHDINVREPHYGVWRLWEELQATYPHFSFLHGNGLGLLVIDQIPSEEIKYLVQLQGQQELQFREFFHRIGQQLTVEYERNHLAGLINAKDVHIHNLDNINASLNETVVTLESAYQQQASAQAQALRIINNQVQDKDRHITNLTNLLTNHEQILRDLDLQTAERQELSRRLYEIESRLSWQLLRSAWDAQARLLAPHTRRGQAWLTMTKGIRKVLPKSLKQQTSKPANIGALATQTNSEQSFEDEYQHWIARTEPSAADLQRQRDDAQQLAYQPLISIITPVFDPPAPILQAMLDSVRDQTYEHWQLCLVDGGSTNPDVHQILEAAASDQRIHVTYLLENLGIAGNSNAAAAKASGEFLALLDHDDRLAPTMLFEVVTALNAQPETDIIYFDEDKLSEDGLQRLDPFFKPDWSPELLLSANYLMHSVLRRQLFEQVGGFRDDAAGAQDWDLLLRCTEQTTAIVHIPKILYHWRKMAGSTAAVFQAKPYVFENQLRTLASHLQRTGIPDATATFPTPGFPRVSWPTRNTKVSIIIPTKEKVDVLQPCLTSLLQRTTYANFEIVLVDNGSHLPATRAYYNTLATEPRVRIVEYPAKFNYSAANNLGARHASGDLLLFLNNDIEVLAPDWLEELVRWAERPDIGIVGTKLLYPDGKIQHAGVVLGMEGHASHIFWGVREHYSGIFGSSDWYRNYLALTGACMMMRRAVFDEVGGFDELYQLAFSDIEICLRVVQAGYRNLYTPYARLCHHEGASRGQHIPVTDMMRGYEQMQAIVAAGDPYYNLNLSYSSRIPRLSRLGEESRIARLKRLCGK